MAHTQESGTVLPFQQVQSDAADGLFREYTDAGLTLAQFGIDGYDPLFWGYHDPNEHWNGWAIPRFRREVMSVIANWLNSNDPGSAWWDGQTFCVQDRDGETTDRIATDTLGLYSFDGWTWLEAGS